MKNIPEFEQADFKISSFCPSHGSRCVQFAYKAGMVAVGDSKNPQQQPLCFDQEEWQAFIKGVKNGEFDLGL